MVGGVTFPLVVRAVTGPSVVVEVDDAFGVAVEALQALPEGSRVGAAEALVFGLVAGGLKSDVGVGRMF